MTRIFRTSMSIAIAYFFICAIGLLISPQNKLLFAFSFILAPALWIAWYAVAIQSLKTGTTVRAWILWIIIDFSILVNLLIFSKPQFSNLNEMDAVFLSIFFPVILPGIFLTNLLPNGISISPQIFFNQEIAWQATLSFWLEGSIPALAQSIIFFLLFKLFWRIRQQNQTN